MPKKSFIKDNPALQFISAVDTEEGSVSEEREPAIPHSRPAEKLPEGYKRNPLLVETKSRRLQLVLQPSLFERVKAKAKASGLSVNEYVHQVLDKATKEK